MNDQLRKIERKIDDFHKSSRVFTYTRPTAILNALRVFEDGCRLGAQAVLSKTGDPVDYSMEIREQLNSIDIVLKWIFSECKPDTQIDSTCDKRYVDFANLHYHHARQYFGIYNAYVSYSRGKYRAIVNEKQRKVSFEPNAHLINIVISNFSEALYNHNGKEAPTNFVLLQVLEELEQSIRVKDKRISYDISDKVWSVAKQLIERQWIESSELPLEWVFDRFSLKEFRDVWIAFGSWMWIHSFACLHSGTVGAALEDVVVVKKKEDVINFISQKSDVSHDVLSNIIDYLVYDSKLKNNDIIFQPLIPLFDSYIAFCPHLFLASRAERNLIMLMHKKKDKSYFNLTNLREKLMITEISKSIGNNTSTQFSVGVKLPGRLPDVDLVFYNKEESILLICELKWLIEADATHEVYAREDDINHGCEQVQSIQQYVHENSFDFIKKAFNEELPGISEIGAIVISKVGIRTTNTKVPVISLKKFIELCNNNNQSLRGLLKDIVAKKYLSPIPPKFKFQKLGVKYANYTFELPGFVKNRKDNKLSYDKEKVGRNELCPCGSEIKYKKCCGS
ncbi:YecA family protein [Brevibacillus sp. SYSU BS000544]|uniref:YecA family protein n=1 Tax=Brevibacillus sp. SYSU BS000544 TaxID=3416443 RepID=UPI003CE572DA